jgi:hypothetical protein
MITVARLHWARHKNRINHSVFLNALLDLAHANIKIGSHLDRTTERDLSITLREMDFPSRAHLRRNSVYRGGSGCCTKLIFKYVDIDEGDESHSMKKGLRTL